MPGEPEGSRKETMMATMAWMGEYLLSQPEPDNEVIQLLRESVSAIDSVVRGCKFIGVHQSASNSLKRLYNTYSKGTYQKLMEDIYSSMELIHKKEDGVVSYHLLGFPHDSDCLEGIFDKATENGAHDKHFLQKLASTPDNMGYFNARIKYKAIHLLDKLKSS